jgi:hypothetical protein|tara:strand:- start:275 stop:553 length:279 start_codon:yes stop_codon:yes gene_type:complete
MSEQIVQSTVMIIIGLAITGIAGSILGYFRTRSKCLREMQKDISDMSKRNFRIEKAIIILARMVDEQTDKAHPELNTDLDGLIKEILRSGDD